MTLPNNATLSYNGVTFDHLYKSKVSGKPHYDEARRTVAYMEWSIEVEAWITSAGTSPGVNDDIASKRKLLTAPGGRMEYSNKGFGTTFVVNDPVGAVRDVAWGPKPELMTFVPVGAENAAFITWKVTVCVPECDTAFYQFGIMELNYGVSYSIDQDGYTTMRTTGYLSIPMTRNTQSDRTLPDNADQYREDFTPEIPSGFRRTGYEWNLSPDKTRIDFTFTDEEMPPDGLPENATTARGRFSVKASNYNMNQWTATITASYVLPRDQPKSNAYVAFFALYVDRVTRAQATGKTPFLISFSASEGLYLDKTLDFELSYMITSPFEDILVNSGIWQQVPGTDPDLWAISVQSVTGPRGAAGMASLPSFDVIVDLCATTTSAGPIGQSTLNSSDPFECTLESGVPIDPDQSWLRYENTLEIILDTETVVHKPLAASFSTIDSLQQIPAYDPLASFTVPTGGTFTSNPVTNPDILQTRTNPTYKVIMRGFAVRALYQVPTPGVASVGGVVPQPAWMWSQTKFLMNLGGVPIIHAEWILIYNLLESPGGDIELPTNPSLRTDQSLIG